MIIGTLGYIPPTYIAFGVAAFLLGFVLGDMFGKYIHLKDLGDW